MGRKERKIVFDNEIGKGEYADAIGTGAVKTEGRINCVHVSFGQMRPDKREEKEEEIVEHCEPIAHVILSENTTRILRDRLKEILGEKEEVK